jgi:hypothetical protein
MMQAGHIYYKITGVGNTKLIEKETWKGNQL